MYLGESYFVNDATTMVVRFKISPPELSSQQVNQGFNRVVMKLGSGQNITKTQIQ